jgi:hypothetical protein
MSFFLLLFINFGFSQVPLYKNRLDVQIYQYASHFLLDHLLAEDIDLGFTQA